MAERLRFDTTVFDMDSVQLRDIIKPTVVIFALSTTGQGEMPQNARPILEDAAKWCSKAWDPPKGPILHVWTWR